MGLFQNHLNSLSELQRLAVLTRDEPLLEQIQVDEWPLAMAACCLQSPPHLGDEQPHAHLVYKKFAEKIDKKHRLLSINQLQLFIKQSEGKGWQALFPFATQDPSPEIRRQACILIATLAPASDRERFTGIEALCEHIIHKPHLRDINVLFLSTLLSFADLRLQNLLFELVTLNDSQLEPLIEQLDCSGNHLSFNWLLHALAEKPQLDECILRCLCRIAAHGGEVIDLVLPIPSWAYRASQPQALHSWTMQDYYYRMLPQLSPHFNKAQLKELATACGI